jgi:DNA-binding SARP family transcriptional activator
MAELEHTDGAVRLAELATVEFFAGDHHSARATIERARECAERTGNRVALPPLAAIEVALDVAASGLAEEHVDRFGHVVAELSADRNLSQFAALITAEFGILLTTLGHHEAARHYLGVAQSALDRSYFAHLNGFRCRRLEGLLLAGEGRHEEGRAVLLALARDAETEGRGALVDIVAADLAGIAGDSPDASRSERAAHLRVQVLSPELVVTSHGEPIPSPRGYAAKLLAVLIAAGGSLTVDAAIEELWPGADPDAGRNRLHGVLLRLRRSLGLPACGPISCVEDMIRLTTTDWFEIDSWEFTRHADLAMRRREEAAAAAEQYTGDVLSVQFAYDDTIESYRRDLRRRFLDVAIMLLADPDGRLDEHELVALARRVEMLAPDDEDAGRAAASVLRRGRTLTARS